MLNTPLSPFYYLISTEPSPLSRVLMFLLFLSILSGFPLSFSYAQDDYTIKDQIVAVINDHIILQSDIDQQVAQYIFFTNQSKKKQISFSQKLWYDMLYQSIDNYAMFEKAIEDSIRVSNEEVDRAINNRIQQISQRLGGERALETQYGKPVSEIRETYRQQFKEELTLQRLRQTILGSITTTRKDVLDYYYQIPEDSLPKLPVQITLSQIIINAPPSEEFKQQTYKLAQSIHDSIITNKKNFEEMAIQYSQDRQSAPKGGLLPALEVNLLMPEYSAAASVLDEGGISEVVETDIGFHIIQLEKQIGTQIQTRHILFRFDEAPPNEQYAIDKLNSIRDSIITHQISFEEAARQFSEDPYTSRFGGRILNQTTGSEYLSYDDLDPALYRIALVLEPNQISEPKLYRNPAKQAISYRIIFLHKKIDEHIANIEQDYHLFYAQAHAKKQQIIFDQWKQNIYNNIFIEIKIDVPKEYQQSFYLN